MPVGRLLLLLIFGAPVYLVIQPVRAYKGRWRAGYQAGDVGVGRVFRVISCAPRISPMPIATGLPGKAARGVRPQSSNYPFQQCISSSISIEETRIKSDSLRRAASAARQRMSAVSSWLRRFVR
jgi:hypothetical protein